MWSWTDPVREVLQAFLSRICAPYIENLDSDRLNYGLTSGQLSLKDLKLKRSALDKFRLPVDVLDGHLGKLQLSIPWTSLSSRPVEILIEDIYLLVSPASKTKIDPEEDERRAQAVKAERLKSSELFQMKGQADDSAGQSQGFVSSLVTKIVNNLQITVHNIHIRYEDDMSCPGHPFAAGVTLAGFSAKSVDEDWLPTFIQSTASSIHKLARLESLVVYFDTDSPSMAGLPHDQAVSKFTSMIASGKHIPDHQFILKPVTGEGKVTLNKKISNKTPKTEVELLFDEIGFGLDGHQYRDIISLIDMYHFYLRRYHYRQFAPPQSELEQNRAKALLKFAGQTILREVHEKGRRYTWAYIQEVGKNRRAYMNLFIKKLLNQLHPEDTSALEALEYRLTYKDIQLYRFLARRQLRRDIKEGKLKKEIPTQKQEPQRQSTGGWGIGWLLGYGSSNNETSQKHNVPTGNIWNMTDEQQRELYEAIDYDQEADNETGEAPPDSLKLHVTARLDKGSLVLKTEPKGMDIISLVSDQFKADIIQRPDNVEGSLALGGFRVFDGTTVGTAYPQIVRVKESRGASPSSAEAPVKDENPFLYLRFEHKPLDGRADNALLVRLRYMEIIYHKGYVEAIYKFFRPPESQLESIDALLGAASETLEGLRQETRAGLEYALNTHKTVDVKMDMQAPIIIVPEDITAQNSRHLVLDAGHIAIESDLAAKDFRKELDEKLNQTYQLEDYQRLEPLMYDRFSLKFESAQFLLGPDLKSCLQALEASDVKESLHIVERINLELLLQTSILPGRAKLPNMIKVPRIKVSGKLPTLQVNVSDTKYKALMRFIDIAIPKLGNPASRQPSIKPERNPPPTFLLPSGLFGNEEAPVYESDDENDGSNQEDEEEFVDAPEATAADIHKQQTFVLNFHVDKLQVLVSRSTNDNKETPIGELSLDRFRLSCAVEDFKIAVDVTLRSVNMILTQTDDSRIPLLASMEDESVPEGDLLIVTYVRIQSGHPHFIARHDGFDQDIKVLMSTFIFHAAPEPVISLYDFIMTTFVPEKSTRPPPPITNTVGQGDSSAGQNEQSPSKIRVVVNLASVQILLINNNARLATLALSTANVSVKLLGSVLRVHGTLGSLTLTDDSQLQTRSPKFKKILMIEGDNLANFGYQTFDPNDKNTFKGVNSLVTLKSGALRVTFLEQPLRNIYQFLIKFGKLKGLYDAAAAAAAQRASEIQRMQFDVSMQSPIMVFPRNPSESDDILVMKLGEITASNAYEEISVKTCASLKGIQLTSEMYHENYVSQMKIIDDVEIFADVLQMSEVDRNVDLKTPDTQVHITVSDVGLHVTQKQYVFIMALAQSIPRALESPPDSETEQSLPVSVPKPETPLHSPSTNDSVVDLQPEIDPTPSSNSSSVWASINLDVKMSLARLHLYDDSVLQTAELKTGGIAKFALNDASLRYKSLTDGASEAELIIKSFTMSNTRSGATRFREIIPAAQHNRNQFMILFTSSGGPTASSLAIITVDSPKIIFSVDPVFSLLDFFSSGIEVEGESLSSGDIQKDVSYTNKQTNTIDFRIDLHDVTISVLESDTDPETQAIQLSVKQVLLSQQTILALTVNRLGMSLLRMDHPADAVRFLDDLDITLSMDNRQTAAQQMSNIELTVQPIVFRVSYRDINLITSIVNKAIELSTQSRSKKTAEGPLILANIQTSTSNPISSIRTRTLSTGTRSKKSSVAPRVITSKEHLKGTLDGFRLVLIGDLHELPVLHLSTKPLEFLVKDWSADLQASTSISTNINFWNISNSHWEPLIDPWSFSIKASRQGPSGQLTAGISSKKRLDMNISTTFVELMLTLLSTWSREGERVLRKARGGDAPYRIRNRTGGSIHVWSDIDGKNQPAVKIADRETVDWRFDDWKTMRERVSGTRHNSIGVQFVGKPWDQLRNIPVDREGEYTYTLRPKTQKVSSRIICEIVLKSNVKVVTLRSTYKVQNSTLYPLELMLLNHAGRPTYAVEKIAPGDDYALPIDAVIDSKVTLRPDQGFGYKWSNALQWEDLITIPSRLIVCSHSQPSEPAWRLQAWTQYDTEDPLVKRYPNLSLRLRAPIELENLLPYNIQYRIFDKQLDQNWSSYLRQGGLMPVHSVDLQHLILLNINVQDTCFKASDWAIINVGANTEFDIERVISLRDPGDRKLDLRLNYIRHPDSGGAFKVQIYSPYIVVNKTDLAFQLRSVRSGRAQDVAGEKRLTELAKPVPFMLSHPHAKGHEFALRIGNSEWSKTLNFETPSAETAMALAMVTPKGTEIHVGISWEQGQGKYELTKVITLVPRFLVKNNLDRPLNFREKGMPPGEDSLLQPGERQALQFTRKGLEKLLTVAYSGLDARWSAPINIQDIGIVHFRMYPVGQESNKPHLIRADVAVEGATVQVILSYENGPWPFIIENHSDYDVSFCQVDDQHPEPKSDALYVMHRVNKHSLKSYAWDYPATHNKEILLTINNENRRVDIMEIGILHPFRFSSGRGHLAVSLDIHADNLTQVLDISNYHEETSLYKPKRAQTGTLSRQGSIGSTQESFEPIEQEEHPLLVLHLDLAGLGLSLINRHMVEVVYISITKLELEYSRTARAQSITFSCDTIQVDNQLHDAIYPVALQPSPLPKESMTIPPPTIQATIIFLNGQEHGVIFIKYASVLLQSLTIRLDEDFLLTLYDMIKLENATWGDSKQDILITHPVDIPEPSLTAGGQYVYFELLDLQPIKLVMSFMTTQHVNADEKINTGSPLSLIFRTLLNFFGNVNDAPFRLNALALKDLRQTVPELQQRIIYHYRQEVTRQVVTMMGFADFIGNPVGLFEGISSGVVDAFYEPWKGAVIHGLNKEFGIGVVKGLSSLIKVSVFGVSDSVSKVTSSLGKGIATATFDPEWDNRRRLAQRRNKPRHIIDGVTNGAEAFATSVGSGLEGLIMKPIEGAEGGALGVLRGFGKGVAGFVAKPAVGIMDLASNLSAGVRNTTTVFDNPARDRVRIPRHIPADGILIPYSAREALGQSWMKDLEQGRYRNERYVAHLDLPGGDNTIMLTTSLVLSFWSTKLRLDWELPFAQIQGINIEDHGILFQHKAGKERDRFVYIADSSKVWFFGQIEQVVKSYNAKKNLHGRIK